LLLLENKINGLESDIESVLSLIKGKDVPIYPFQISTEETSNLTDEQYIDICKEGISSCHRGDVFQIVLSRRFQQSFYRR
jgi:anthranilate synthase component 1